MRCKVGDLAVIVSCVYAENIGGLVEVLSLDQLDIWFVKPLCRVGRVTGTNTGITRLHKPEVPLRAKDSQLRPLRPDGGKDETLTWKEKETA